MKIPLKFKETKANTGTATFQRLLLVDLSMDKKPLQGSDLVAGQAYSVNAETGEVKKVKTAERKIEK